MTTEPGNLVLEYMRALRTDLGLLRETQMEHGVKLNRIGDSLGDIKRDAALQAERLTRVEARLDQVRSDLRLIERQLALTGV